MIIFNNNSIGYVPDVDASKVIEAVRSTGVTITPAMMHYAHYLISNMKNIGTWQLSNAVYGFVGGTAASHKFNWKDLRDVDAAFRLTYTNVTHSSNGIVGNGTNSIANTFINSTTINKNSVAFGIYPTVVNNAGVLGGFRETSLVRLSINGNAFSAMSQTTTGYGFNATKGMLLLNRNSSSTSYIIANDKVINQNVTSIASTQVNYVGLLNRYIEGALNAEPASYFNGTIGFSFLTTLGLTDTQSIQQSQIVTNAQLILNRA